MIEDASRSAANYRPEIDGLRALAVTPVVLFHAGVPYLENGFLGVDVFFVISGYLITRLLTNNGQHRDYSLREFYERRVRRIAPALFVVIACTAVLSVFIVAPVRMLEIAKSIIAASAFSANFWFLSQDGYFATPSTLQPLIHVWSLAVEEQFYIVFPMVLLLLRRQSRAHKAIALGALAIASISYSQYLSITDANAAFFRPDTRAWELLLGATCALCPAAPRRWKELIALSGIVLIFLAYFVLPKPLAPNFLSVPICLGTALVIIGAGCENTTGRALGARWLVLIGLVSYSLYLWHQPLLALARIARLGPISGLETAAVLGVSFCLSLLTWHFVEIPARNHKLVSTSKIIVSTFAGMFVLIVFATFALGTSGLSFRYGDKASEYLATIDLMDDSNQARATAIRMGVCHFGADTSPPIQSYLANWTCEGGETGNGILVVGDSHAADVAAGFKLNGMDIGQMTGAGCGLSPKEMSKDCLLLFDFVKKRRNSFRLIVMANDQTAKKYLEEDIEAVLAFWGPMDLPIIWLSDMPQFPAINDRRAKYQLKYGDPMDGNYPILIEDAQSNYSAMKRIAAGRFDVLDSSHIYCSIANKNGRCLPYLKGEGWLAAQTGHLTAVGARRFVERMLASSGNFDPH